MPKKKMAKKPTRADRIAASKAFDAQREKEFIASLPKLQAELALAAKANQDDQILFARLAAGEDAETVYKEMTAKRKADQAFSESTAKAEEEKSGADVD